MKDTIPYRYFNNEATSEEVEQLEAWLKADPEHMQEFDAAHTLFNTIVLQQLHYDAGAEHKKMKRRSVHRFARIAVRTAAAVVLAVSAACIGGKVSREETYRTMAAKTNVLEVPAGQRISIRLEDGTSVFLNGGSRMEYPQVFARDCRHVKLSGEALFEVTHNAERPFIVETYASEIEVLGTKFNVYADEKNNRFTTTLAEGRIRATHLAGNIREQVILNPNEMLRIDDNGRFAVSRVDAPDALCWTEGYINIRGVAFDELMQRFENAYDVKIFIDRATMPKIGYTSGKIRISEGVDFALHLLQQAGDFTFTHDKESNTITVR